MTRHVNMDLEVWDQWRVDLLVQGMYGRKVLVSAKAEDSLGVADLPKNRLNGRPAAAHMTRVAPAHHHQPCLGGNPPDVLIIFWKVDHRGLGQISRIGAADRHHIELVVGADTPDLSGPATHAINSGIPRCLRGT